MGNVDELQPEINTPPEPEPRVASAKRRQKMALVMAAEGFRIFPCKASSKEPACMWQRDATTDPAVIREWFKANPDMNYGVSMDETHFVLDLDCKKGKDGQNDLEVLEISNGDLPNTLRIRTPSGGYHVYFTGNAANSVGKKELGGGIDVRAKGGYVVGAGSVIDGKAYEIVTDAEIADAPAWLLELVERHVVEPAKRDPSVALDAPAEVGRMRAYLESLVTHGDVAIEYCGGNNRTYKLVCLLMDYVSEETCLKLMSEIWNPACSPPWDDSDLRSIVEHAVKHRQNDIGAKAGKPPAEVFKDAIFPIPDAEGFRRSGGLSFRSMRDIRPVEFDWLWPERIAAGKFSLLAGAPDGGKSQIAAYIAATVSNGGPWPFGEGTAEKGAVIWLSAEDDAADTTVPRLIAAGANRELIFELRSVVRVEDRLRPFNVVNDLDELAKVVETIKAETGVSVRLIVIDPISAYMGGNSQTNSWKNSDVRNTMTPLNDFVAKVGISTIAITHFKKGRDDENVLNKVIDSVALPALSRATWLVAPEIDDEGNLTDRRLFLSGKKNIGRPVPSLAYRIVEKLIDNGRGGTMPAPRIEWAGIVAATANEAFTANSGKAAGKLEAAEDFLQLILADGPVSEREIRKRAGDKHRFRTLQRAKEKLGVVSRKAGFDREWCWQLPGYEAPEDPDDESLGVTRAGTLKSGAQWPNRARVVSG
jgi:hypothetical protein